MLRRVGYLRLRWCSMVWTARRRPKPAAWTVRPCGTGCMVRRRGTGRASRYRKSPGPGSKLTARQQAELAELVDAGPDPRCTVSYAGGGSICATNCSGASVSRCMSVFIRQPPADRELRRHHTHALSERRDGSRSAHQLGGQPAGPDDYDPARMASLRTAWQRAGGMVPGACRHVHGRTPRIAIVAIARKLLIALWRYVETGVILAGVELRSEAVVAT